MAKPEQIDKAFKRWMKSPRSSAATKAMKRVTSKHRRRAEKRDPENAPRRLRDSIRGWMS
jgi:hypothetical protein